MARKLSKEIPKSARSPILYRILYPILSPLFRVLFRIQCTGLENVPMTEGCIVCPNHISNADAIAIGAMLLVILIIVAVVVIVVRIVRKRKQKKNK